MGDRDIKVDDEACTGNTARGHRWRVVLRRAAGACLAEAEVRRGDLRAPLSASCRGLDLLRQVGSGNKPDLVNDVGAARRAPHRGSRARTQGPSGF